MSGFQDDTPTRLKVSSEAVHQRRRRAAGAGALLLAAVVVWGISSIGGSSSTNAPADSFSARLAKVGGIGNDSLYAKSTASSVAAVDSVLQTTQYIVKAGGEKKAVALTFDDGPSEYTPKILSILRSNGVAGTFFNVGGMIKTFGPNSDQALQAGNAVGDHTWTHPQLPSMGIGDQASEIDRTASALVGIGIPQPRLFRPPYGAYDANTLALMKKNKMLLVLWDIDSLDWTKPGSDAIFNNVMNGVTNGSIILMHDGGGDRSETVAALPRIIAALRKRGFAMVTVPRLLAEDPPQAGAAPSVTSAGA
jgi:peptidoglycan/xylan/chitin deacetylase (PgdA/CDA1 family)